MRKSSPRLVVRAALIGALPAELLLRAVPWGINLPLATLVAVAALLFVTGRDDERFVPRALFGAVLIGLASIIALRAPSLLYLAVFTAAVPTLALMLLPDARRLWRADPFGTQVRAGGVLVQTGLGPLRLLGHDLDWRRSPGEGALLPGSLRGLAWSLPAILPFLLLFGSADPVFGAAVQELVDLPQLATHVILWGALAWLAVGWLGSAELPWGVPDVPAPRMNGRDAVWVLGTLAVVFDVFVALQLRWFFGGESLVQEVMGLTYAEYARRGFFELVTVAALLLAVLLVIDGVTRGAERTERRNLRLLSVVLLAFLGVVLASALWRMRLYVAQYGLTEDRFFATAFMLWLVVVFGWFCATVLRDARDRFLGGVWVSGVLAVFALAALDPMARIAAFNVAQAPATGRFDVAHALRLGDDAVPVLAASVGGLSPAHACPLAVGLVWKLDDERGSDWRSWNLARARAERVLTDAAPAFERACGPIQRGGSR